MHGDPWESPASWESKKPEPADWGDLFRATKELHNEIAVLNSLIDDVAKARLIKEVDSDRRKQALARGIVRSGVNSVAGGEVAARTDQKYIDDLKGLDAELLMAEKTMARWVVSQAKIESLRSLISAAKETLRNV